MRYALLLVLLFIVPATLGKVAIYAKGFSTECYIYRSPVEELIPQSPFILASFLKDSGIDAEVVEDSERLSNYDGIVVLSCTTLSAEDVSNILSAYRGGSGLLIDGREENPLMKEFNVFKKNYPLEGVERSSLETVYVSVKNGVYLSHPVVDPSGPLVYGYEKMYYVGEPLATVDNYRTGFVTSEGENVLLWKVDGKKRVVITGCLFCSDPLLLANLADWIEDGSVDFPKFTITRRVIPDIVLPGSTLVDLITVSVDREIESVRGEYLYNVSGGSYCDFGEPSPEFSPLHLKGPYYEMEVKFMYKASGNPKTCMLPPALITLEGTYGSRRVIVDPVEVTVSGKDVVIVQSVIEGIPKWALVVVGIALLLGVLLLHRELEKRKLLKEWKKYRDLVKLTKKRRLVGELSEEAYKELMKVYEEKLQEIEVELRMRGVKLENGTIGRGQQPEGRGQRKARAGSYH